MATVQDTYADATKIFESQGTEVSGGVLRNVLINNQAVLSFDGTNDYISVADDASLDISSNITLSVWVKILSLNANITTLIAKGDNTATNYTIDIHPTNGIRWFGYQSAVAKGITSSSQPPYGSWVKIDGTFDGTTWNLYVNGVLLKTQTDSATLSTNASALQLGLRSFTPTNYYFRGQMANVAIYNDVRTPDEIKSDFITGSVDVSDANIVARWKLDEDTGTTADNAEGTAALDGTISGATWTDTSLYVPIGRTNQDNKLDATSTIKSLTNLKYTSVKKPGGTRQSYLISQDFDENRQNLLAFDGSGDYVSCGSDASLDDDTTKSFAAWVNLDLGKSGTHRIIDKYTTAGYLVFVDEFGSLGLLHTFSGTDLNMRTANGTIASGQWNHIAVTYNNSSAANVPVLYINGKSMAVDTGDASYAVPTGTVDSDAGETFIIGSDTAGVQPKGYIADLRYYDDILTANEVLYLATSGKEGTDPTSTNLISYWKLNEGTGTSAADSAGSNTGTITGTGTWETNADLANIKATWKNSNDNVVKQAGCFSFDGVNDRIELSSTSTFDHVNGNPLSFTCWFKTSTSGVYQAILDTRGGGAYNEGVLIGVNNTNTITFYILDSVNVASNLQTTRTFNDGRWHFLACVYEDVTNYHRIYVDGILEAETTVELAGISQSYSPNIGWHATSLTSAWTYFNGSIKDVAYYEGVELSQSDILNLMRYTSLPSDLSADHWWPLDLNTFDIVSTNHGTRYSGVSSITNWTALPYIGDAIEDDNALLFDGTNDSISIADHSSLSFGNSSTDSAFSVSAWVKMSDATFFRILHKGDTTNAEWNMSITSVDRLAFVLYDNDYSNYTYSDSAQLLTSFEGQWIHVGASYTGVGGSTAYNGVTLYLNGIAQAKNSATQVGSYTAMHDTATSLNIGYLPSGATYAKGIIGTVNLWNDVRTAAEFLADFEAGYTSTADGNIVSQWRLNAGTGTSAADSVGSNTGTISGATWVKDQYRPISAAPSQQTIDISGITFTKGNNVYIRSQHESIVGDRTNTVTELTLEYAKAGGGLALVGVG